MNIPTSAELGQMSQAEYQALLKQLEAGTKALNRVTKQLQTAARELKETNKKQ